LPARIDFAYAAGPDGRVLLFGGAVAGLPEPLEDGFPDEEEAPPCALEDTLTGLRSVSSLTLEAAPE
jgi:hypothetical protein